MFGSARTSRFTIPPFFTFQTDRWVFTVFTVSSLSTLLLTLYMKGSFSMDFFQAEGSIDDMASPIVRYEGTCFSATAR